MELQPSSVKGRLNFCAVGNHMAEPYCLAMVLCDSVHRDPSTGKFTILGTFDTFRAREFPARVSLSIYLAITDGMGPTTLRIQLIDAKVGFVDAQCEEPIEGRVFILKTDCNFDHPLQVTGLGGAIPKAGLYHCELWANNELLMTRRMMALQATTEERNDGE